MKKFLKLAAIVGFITLLTTGCASRATSRVDSSTNLSALKTMYVKKIPADKGGTNLLIADKLRSKGVTVTTGVDAPPSNVDAVVTYADRWRWDITMYMIELTIAIRDPQTDFPIATGNSFHGSLSRMSPSEMVDEVVDNIYKGTK